jgi:hypothetical protein
MDKTIFQRLGLAYGLLWRLMRLLAHPRAGFIGAGLLAALVLFTGSGQAVDMLAYAVAWFLLHGVCRALFSFLPRPPAGGNTLPTEAPLPPATMAVSITQPAPPESCPDLPAMVAALPEELRNMLQQ